MTAPLPAMRPGYPYPLGAQLREGGANFAVFSESAERVQLCLFDESGEHRLELYAGPGHVFHGFVPGVGPGQRYGYRVWSRDGAFGACGSPSKLLIDPYARDIDGEVIWHPSLYDHGSGAHLDSSAYVPRSLVIGSEFDWQDDAPPRTPWRDTVIYETHVKGFTRTRKEIPEPLRGTYAGLGHEASIAYLRDLGVTAVELLPIHALVHDERLVRTGLRNYWGYNSIGFFAPHADYSSRRDPGGAVIEFKEMVRSMHRAGIEVILDVVYNHTAEGGRKGPILSFRGLDNGSYYQLDATGRHTIDFTGCGNTIRVGHRAVLRLISDSLRYWATEMHVDGFRFDLAVALSRDHGNADMNAALFDILYQDPVLQRLKLIAEPWDLGPDGYQLGKFPSDWSEINGKFRDTARDFWRGRSQTLGEFAYRLTGSSDLYHVSGRRPQASINFVTCHDGFTLRDLVSYDRKHNLVNGEQNWDGSENNRSWNCGIEGPTTDPAILALRSRQQRNFMASLLLSQGVPLLLAGDELGRTQWGNNNPYCQDNPISWFDWENVDRDLQAFVRDLLRFRLEHSAFRQIGWFDGMASCGRGLQDLGWFRPDGHQMSSEDWNVEFAKAIAVFLNGRTLRAADPDGRVLRDDNFLLLFNASEHPVSFSLPTPLDSAGWKLVLDTERSLVAFGGGSESWLASQHQTLVPRSLRAFQS